MTYINLNNGNGRDYSAGEAAEAITEARRKIGAGYWDEIAAAMDAEIRERVHNEFAPCSEAEFLAAYLIHAQAPIIIG